MPSTSERRGATPGSTASGAAVRGPNANLAGIGLIVAAMALFSCSDALSKYLAASLPPLEIAWLRWSGFMLFALPNLMRTRGGVLRSAAPGIQIGRSLGLLGSSAMFILALQSLPMATATATSFVSPLIVTALSIPLLGERVGIRRWAAIAVGLVGVLVVVRPGSGILGPATLYPLISAFGWAFGVIFTRLGRGIDGFMTSMTYTAAIGLAVLSALVPFVWVTPTLHDLALAAPMALAATGAQILVVVAYHRAPASVLAPFSYTQIVWSILFGYVLFAGVPDVWTMLGTAIIIASGLYTAHRERRVAGGA